MKLRTELKSTFEKAVVHHGRPAMLIGSCFSDNIGARLSKDLFEVLINPTGTLFNPRSIADAMERIAAGRLLSEDELFEYRGLWHSPLHHSRFSRRTPGETLECINAGIAEAHSLLPNCETVFITLGSTRTFFDRERRMVVANCHKLPADRFIESDLSLANVTIELNRILRAVACANIVLTVSPVRHTAYGLEANALAKATLRIACAQAASADSRVIYFPAYEIMTDDLRDYRFYDADLKHPTPLAVDYIYEHLCTRFMDSATRTLARQCAKLSGRLGHRCDPNNPETEIFNGETQELASELLKHNPCLKRAISEAINRL